MNRGSIYNPSFKTNRYVPLRGDRTLRSVHPPFSSLSCDRTLTSIRSTLTGRVRSQKLPSRTLLMLTGLWHPKSGHFAAQRPVSSQNLTSVRSALTGRVWSQKLLSETLLMLNGLWNPVSGHFAAQRLVSSQNLTSVWSALSGRVRSGFSLSGTLLELTELWHPASGRIQTTSPWSNELTGLCASVRSHRNQRPVNI